MWMIHDWLVNKKFKWNRQKKLNENFKNICHFFVANKLCIHIGNDKTKSIIFANKKGQKAWYKIWGYTNQIPFQC